MRAYWVLHDERWRAAMTLWPKLARKAGRESNIAAARELAAEAKMRLRRLGHPPETKTPSLPGMPPAAISGHLASSITHRTGADSTLVGPTARYARIQELGGFMRGHPYMYWREDGVKYRSSGHSLPARPYWEPSVHELVESGRLTRIYRDRWRAAQAAVTE